MIQLTRLNNLPLVINSDLIKFIETAHDTVITLLTGEKVVVQESAELVIERIVEFRRRIHQDTHRDPDALDESSPAVEMARRLINRES